MPAYSYRVTLANGKDAFVDTDSPATSDELQAATDQFNQQNAQQAQDAAARAQADQQAGPARQRHPWRRRAP